MALPISDGDPVKQLQSAQGPTMTTGPSNKIVDTKQEAVNQIIKFLKYFSMYKLIVLTSIAVYCLIDDQVIIATVATVSLFCHILYAKGLQEKWIVVLRLYQVFYLVFAAIMTTTTTIDLIKLFRGVPVRYIRFFFWTMLVLPTIPSIFIINQLINLLYALQASKQKDTTAQC